MQLKNKFYNCITKALKELFSYLRTLAIKSQNFSFKTQSSQYSQLKNKPSKRSFSTTTSQNYKISTFKTKTLTKGSQTLMQYPQTLDKFSTINNSDVNAIITG
ncbi:hypothetical protein ABPG72_010391 [Tetrahymena utriculariae]